MKRSRPELVLLRFQLRSGARVASRTLAPLAAGFTAAAVITGSPLIVLSPIAYLLFPPGPATFSAIAAACVLGMTSAALAPRLRPGLAGWVRHLPATSSSRRRAATAGLAIASSPVLAIILAAGTTMLQSSPLSSTCRLFGIPMLAVAAAHAALPVGLPSRVLATLSAAFSFVGSPWALIAGFATLVAADRSAGDHDFKPTTSKRRGATGFSRSGFLWVTITLRALGARTFVVCLASLFILVPLLFFVSNNGLTSSQSHIAVRFAGLTAAVFITAALADGLTKRRPPWPWARSLPWSAGRRVTLDALILGAAALPALLGAGLIRPVTLPSMLIMLPFLALRATAAVRSAPGRASGASGQLMAEGFLVAAATAVLPLLGLLAIPATPLALRLAADGEKNHDVSRWHELHHVAAGDSTSWSDA